jgi:propanol-preferring alcohol dehydrogenase
MKKTMLGLLFPGDKETELREFDVPEPGLGEVLLEMKASAMCGSDLEYLYKTPKSLRGTPVLGVESYPDIITGHEPCGIVVKKGEGVRYLNVGDRVGVYHISGCGKCKYCKSGWQILCTNNHKTYGFSRNGGNADYMVTDEKDCVILPDNVSYESGAYCSCGAGTAFQVTKRLGISGLDNVVIFGAGPVGLAATLLASFMGGRVITVDFNEKRLALAKDHGAVKTINPNKEDVLDVVKSFTHKEGASVTIDCSASPIARNLALDCAKIWGRVAFVGEGNKTTFDPSPQILHKELTVIGSWVFSIPVMMELVEYISRYDIPLDELITDRFVLQDGDMAFKKFESGETVGKSVFKWD